MCSGSKCRPEGEADDNNAICGRQTREVSSRLTSTLQYPPHSRATRRPGWPRLSLLEAHRDRFPFAWRLAPRRRYLVGRDRRGCRHAVLRVQPRRRPVERVAALQAAFAGVPHAIHYALKANSTLAVRAAPARPWGAGADANSVGEIEVALRAGFIPERDRVHRRRQGARRARARRRASASRPSTPSRPANWTASMPSPGRREARARVALRVNPDIDAETHRRTSPPASSATSSACPIDDGRRRCRRVRRVAPGWSSSACTPTSGPRSRTSSRCAARPARWLTLAATCARPASRSSTSTSAAGWASPTTDGATTLDVADYGRAIVDATRRAPASHWSSSRAAGSWPRRGRAGRDVVDVKTRPGGRALRRARRGHDGTAFGRRSTGRSTASSWWSRARARRGDLRRRRPGVREQRYVRARPRCCPPRRWTTSSRSSMPAPTVP